jgi:hypothetical protein
MAELKRPGVALGVIAGGREYAAGFGVTNVDHPLPVTTNTLFQIGSTGSAPVTSDIRGSPVSCAWSRPQWMGIGNRRDVTLRLSRESVSGKASMRAAGRL